MSATGIESARHKLRRAKQHADEFAVEVEAFAATEPLQYEVQWRPEDESDDEIRCSVVTTKSEDAPDSLSVIIGDCLTNLRAALDHVIFEHGRATLARTLRRDPTEDEERSLYFPLARTRKGAKSAKRYLMPAIYEYILSLHDFENDWQSTNPVVQNLAFLRIFVNYDKHRAVVPSNQADMHFNASHSDEHLKLIDGQFVRGAVAVGETFLTLRFQKLHPLTDIPRADLLWNLTIKFPLVLRVPKDPSLGTVQINKTPTPAAAERLYAMCDAVDGVLDELERLGV